jgi:hypothetical protein
MTHYSLEEWAEFALGSGAAEQRSKLQRHLDGGCMECMRMATMWTRVREMAAREETFVPPQSALHYARALFRMLPPREAGNPVIEWCRMVFDSSRQPALAGVRGSAAGPRRVVFQGGPLILDVVMEPRSDDQPISLVGQISEPSNPGGRFESLSVSVAPDSGEVVHTTTSYSGEFQVICSASRSLLFLVHLPNRSVMISPLAIGGPENYS